MSLLSHPLRLTAKSASHFIGHQDGLESNVRDHSIAWFQKKLPWQAFDSV